MATDIAAIIGIRPVGHDQLADFYNAADVCVWPADCTISHLEASACGRPIIIPSDMGVSDRIAAGNGIEVRVGDVAQLAAVLADLLANKLTRQRMGEAGRRLCVRDFSWEAIAARFIAEYQSLMRGQVCMPSA